MNKDQETELNEFKEPAAAVAALRTTTAIRERAHALLARARRDESRWFTIGSGDAMEDAARAVAHLTRERFGNGPVQYHSRWRHFEAGGIDRLAKLDELLGPQATPRERARVQIDLVLVSVLLDADAGTDWHYVESASGQKFTQSEGLAVASFHAFTSGLFSSDPDHPLRADAAGLRGLVTDRLGDAFQVSSSNPLAALAGRATLLRRLGEALSEQPEIFAQDGGKARPGGLFDAAVGPFGPGVPATAEVGAHALLSLVLAAMSRIGPAANAIDRGHGPDGLGSGDPAFALGDCWHHSAVKGPGLTRGWMPFHQLSQWLTCSLLEPFERAGVKVRGVDVLTGLPSYRNGGLFLDAGVIVPRDRSCLARRWKVGDEFIVEWRALTVALLDELAPHVRQALGRSLAEMPLACMVEVDSAAAGQASSSRLHDGAPPLSIESDGTVF